MKKTISAVLCLLLLLSALPLAVSAQTCAWDYWVGTNHYTSAAALNNADIPGLRVVGTELELNNYTGTSIAAIPHGNIGDDDSPVLRIKLVGTNTLTGSYFTLPVAEAVDEIPEDSDGMYCALYADLRRGGYGADSSIYIGGTGTLNINVKKDRCAFNIYGIFCGDTLQVDSGRVNITFGGRGIDGDYAIGASAENVIVNSTGILHIKSDVASLRKIVGGHINSILSSSAVYGVEGNVTASANGGWFASDLLTASTTSGKEVYAVKGNFLYNNIYTIAYLIGTSGVSPVSGTEKTAFEDTVKSFVRYSFDNGYDRYIAYGPKQKLLTTSSLQMLTVKDLLSEVDYAKLGDSLLVGKAVKCADKGFFAEKKVGLVSIADKTFVSLEGTVTPNEPSTVYRSETRFYPLPGYWFTPGYGDYTTDKIKSNLDCTVYENTSAGLTTGFSGNCLALHFRRGSAPVITKQPQPVDKDSTKIEVIATNATEYEWFLRVYNADYYFACEIPMSDFDEMNYGFTCQTDSAMHLGSFEADETVPGYDFTFGEAGALCLFCKVSNESGSVQSNEVVYNAFKSGIILLLSYGDLDGKDGVTAADARLALRASVKLETLTDAQTKVADVDGKDGVTAADARLILRYAVKLETKFPVEN